MPEEGEEEEPLRRKGDKTARPRQCATANGVVTLLP
jgi:hypothetical protein